MFIIILVLLVPSLNKRVVADSDFPVSPCPDVFSYERTSENDVHGVVRCKNDFSGFYRVEVNMTLAAYIAQNIAIRRQTPTEAVQNGDDIVYHVIFPPAGVLPKVTTIAFNNKLLCTALPDPGGFTTLTAFHYFATPVLQRSLVRPNIQSPDHIGVNAIPKTSPVSFVVGDNKHFDSSTKSYTLSLKPVAISSDLQQSSTASVTTDVPNNPPKTSTLQVTIAESRQASSTLTPYTRHLDPLSSSQTFTASTANATSKQSPTSAEPSTQPSNPVNIPDNLRQTTSTISTFIIASRFLEEDECGLAEDTEALLVHGSPTSENQHPWLIAMFHLQESTGEYKFKCAATLVSNRHVITAAHCVRIGKSKDVPKDDIILVLGRHNIRSWAVKSEIRDADKIYIHPQYKQPSDADIAAIIMSKAVEFTSTIKPICLWEENSDLELIVGTNGTVIGWGRDELDNAYVPEPKKLNLPVVSQEDCLRADERFLKLTSHRTFCAGNRNGEAPCTGDSGGGFIMKRRGRWTLRGIVSSALVDPDTRSCDVNNYVVFADVTKYMDWIEHVMKK